MNSNLKTNDVLLLFFIDHQVNQVKNSVPLKLNGKNQLQILITLLLIFLYIWVISTQEILAGGPVTLLTLVESTLTTFLVNIH